jgi:hypothetical protein
LITSYEYIRQEFMMNLLCSRRQTLKYISFLSLPKHVLQPIKYLLITISCIFSYIFGLFGRVMLSFFSLSASFLQLQTYYESGRHLRGLFLGLINPLSVSYTWHVMMGGYRLYGLLVPHSPYVPISTQQNTLLASVIPNTAFHRGY